MNEKAPKVTNQAKIVEIPWLVKRGNLAQKFLKAPLQIKISLTQRYKTK